MRRKFLRAMHPYLPFNKTVALTHLWSGYQEKSRYRTLCPWRERIPCTEAYTWEGAYPCRSSCYNNCTDPWTSEYGFFKTVYFLRQLSFERMCPRLFWHWSHIGGIRPWIMITSVVLPNTSRGCWMPGMHLVMHGNHMRQPCLVLTSIVLCSIQTAWSLQNT